MAINSSRTGPMSTLLSSIQANTQKYIDFFEAQGLSEPSYEDGDGLDPRNPLPMEIQAAKNAALEATDELHHLLLGPTGIVATSFGQQYLTLSLEYIYTHNLAEHVPSNGSEVTFDDLARASGADVKDLTRILRIAIGRHIFSEPRKGHVTHTAASRALLANPLLKEWLLNIGDLFGGALTRTVEATLKWPGSEEPNETGYALAKNTDENPFDHIKKDPRRNKRFAESQRFSHMHQSFSMDYLLNGYDFDPMSTVVDVGGSQGLVALALVRKFPGIKRVTVQDLPDTIHDLHKHIPAEFHDKIKGQAHDFFTPQPVKGADLYLLRWVLHDWSDKYCVKILKSLIPALRKGAKVVVNDVCMPEPGQLPIAMDRWMRLMDVSMKAFNNASERDAETWKSLFTIADPRFQFLGITIPEGARMAIIEAEWTGRDFSQTTNVVEPAIPSTRKSKLNVGTAVASSRWRVWTAVRNGWLPRKGN